MLLFLFLVFQIMRSPKVISAPGGREKIDDMVRDPNLDRMSMPQVEDVFKANTDGSNWRATRTSASSKWRQLRPEQSEIGSHQCNITIAGQE